MLAGLESGALPAINKPMTHRPPTVNTDESKFLRRSRPSAVGFRLSSLLPSAPRPGQRTTSHRCFCRQPCARCLLSTGGCPRTGIRRAGTARSRVRGQVELGWRALRTPTLPARFWVSHFGDIIPGSCTLSLQWKDLQSHLDRLPDARIHSIPSHLRSPQGCGIHSARDPVTDKGPQDTHGF